MNSGNGPEIGHPCEQNVATLAPVGEYVSALECDGEVVTLENIGEMTERLWQWLAGKRFTLAPSRADSSGWMMAECYEQAHLAEDIGPPVFHRLGGAELEEIHICVRTHEIRYYWLTVLPCYPGAVHPQRRRTDITFEEHRLVIKCRSVGGTCPRPRGEPEVFPGSLVVYTFTMDTRAASQHW